MHQATSASFHAGDMRAPASTSVLNVSEATEYWEKTMHTRKALVPHSQSVWQGEIAAMTAQLANAKSYFNTLSALYSLPDELIATILEILAFSNPFRSAERAWGWMAVTHVTRYFRNIALGHAILWTALTLDKDIPWDTFLTRSRSSLLDVSGSSPDRKRSAGWISQLVQNVERLQSLSIEHIGDARVSDFSDAKTWLRMLKASAPELRSLKLDFDCSESEPQIITNFLMKRAPKLQEMQLSGVYLPWNLTSTLSLRSLTLDNENSGNRIQSTFGQVLSSLRNLPLLEELVLWGALPPTDESAKKERIPLSRLRLLFVADQGRRALALWWSLNLPPTCTIRIESEKLGGEGISLLTSLFKRHFEQPNCPTYRRVTFGDNERNDENPDLIHLSLHSESTTGVADDAHHELVRYLSRSSLYGSRYRIDSAPMLSLSFPVTGRGEHLRAMLDLIPSKPVQTLFITEYLPHNLLNVTNFIADLIVHFRSINTLRVQCDGGTEGYDTGLALEARKLSCAFFACLVKQSQSQSEPETLICLPDLTSLSLDSFEFWDDIGDRPRRTGTQRLIDILATFVKARSLAGMRLSTLTMSRSIIDASWRKLWEPWVTEVKYYDDIAYKTLVEASSDEYLGSSQGSDTNESDG